MRRAVVIAGALTVAFAMSAVASAAEPVVPDANLRASVRHLDTRPAVRDLDLIESVTPLREEKSEGNLVTVRISSDVLFEFDRATLTEAARREIGRIATRMRGVTGAVRVSGHSDGVGRPAYNLTLSRARAKAVMAELRRLLAGADVRIVAAGYGETRPVAPNTSGGEDDPEGRAKNRRVEITFQRR